MLEILYHPHFQRNYKKLSKSIKIFAEAKEKLFRKNIFDSRLQTHKLSGRLRNIWSFSVDNNYRILFVFDKKDNNTVIFIDVGTHEIYQ